MGDTSDPSEERASSTTGADHAAVNALSGAFSCQPGVYTIMMVDRYANVKRVTQMILEMDASTPPQSAE